MTNQAPIGSGFGATSAAAEVIAGVDLSGKTAIVTGGYSGIGTETTRALSAAGATVIVPARDPDKAGVNLAGVPRVERAVLDLLDPASIDRFAASVVDSGRPVHLLIHSAGVMAAPLTRDARGYEIQFSANHLGHFQLAARLWPALERARGARVVALSSRGHRYSAVDFDDPNFQRRDYDKWQAYGQSKTANALFAMELDRRGAASGVRAFSVHPGGIHTDLGRHLGDDDYAAMGITRAADGSLTMGEGNPLRLKTVPQGAATTVWCATSPRLEGMGGVYCEDCDIAPVAAPDQAGGRISALAGVLPWACDPIAAARLWTLSERLTGVAYPV